MQAFLDSVIRGLVDHPDAVRITPHERGGATVYEVSVHPSDTGRLVGRRGNTINAIRTLLAVGAAQRGVRCSVELNEDGRPRRPRA
jgi:hypothetical protein